MNDVLHLRRHMSETPAFFDMQRERWRRSMRAMCPQPARSRDGRFTNKGNNA